jgi:predicted RNA binding protein YcfA (HicA-like mRNA interferase family)
MDDAIPIRKPEIVGEAGDLVDETRFTRGIHGEDLDPDEISRLLGYAPTSAHRRGEPRRSGSPWPNFSPALLDIIYGIVCLVTSADVIRALKRDGWSEVRAKGSHHHFKHPTKPGIVTVPHPKRTSHAGRSGVSSVKQASG